MDDLHKACIIGDIKAVQLILNSGVNIKKKVSGLTPLHLASDFGYINIVKLLLDSGVDIETQCNIGWTSLHMASQNEHMNIVKLLLDSGANIKAKDNIGLTPKQLARYPTLQVFKSYEHMIELKKMELIKLNEWRPWNHSKYPIKYCNTMKTLLILAKQRK